MTDIASIVGTSCLDKRACNRPKVDLSNSAKQDDQQIPKLQILLIALQSTANSFKSANQQTE